MVLVHVYVQEMRKDEVELDDDEALIPIAHFHKVYTCIYMCIYTCSYTMFYILYCIAGIFLFGELAVLF